MAFQLRLSLRGDLNFHVESRWGQMAVAAKCYYQLWHWFHHVSAIPCGPRGKRKQLLKDITAHVRSGEVLAIIGGSGAGKTTLLDTAAQRIKVSSGPGTGSLPNHPNPMFFFGMVSSVVLCDFEMFFPLL